MSGLAWIAFLTAAGVAAPSRYLLDGWVQDRTGGRFPWGTLVVNVSGCLLLGLLTGGALYHGHGDTAGTVIGTGGLGAFTTFSTFSYETVCLANDGAVDKAVRNVALTLVVGLAAAVTGLAIAATL